MTDRPYLVGVPLYSFVWLILSPGRHLLEQLTMSFRKLRFLPDSSQPAGAESSDSEEMNGLHLFSHEEVISIMGDDLSPVRSLEGSLLDELVLWDEASISEEDEKEERFLRTRSRRDSTSCGKRC